MVRSHTPSRHTLTVSSLDPVMTRPAPAAATHNTKSVCPASVTTSLENFRTLIALRAATLITWDSVQCARCGARA